MSNRKFDIHRQHPEYSRNMLRWKMCYDFYRGGVHVLDPEGDRSRSVNFYEGTDSGSEASGIDPEKDRVRSKFRWVPYKTNSYLHSHERESYNRWIDRNARAYHIPLCQPIVDIYGSAIMRNSPKREGKEGNVSAEFREYFANTDLAGTSMDLFMSSACNLAMTFSHMFAVTDKEKSQQVHSKLDEQALGIRAYSYLVTPLDVPDWSLDKYGNLEWIKIVEHNDNKADPFYVDSDGGEICYKIWTKTEWIKILSKNDGSQQYQIIDQGYHNLGVVPVSILCCKKPARVKNSIACQGLIDDLVDVDRSIFNLCSLLDEIDYGQTFSQLAVPMRSGVGLSPLELSIYSAIAYDSDAGEPRYLSPDPQMAAGIAERIDKRFEYAKRAASLSRGNAELSMEARSAQGITLESESKYNLMSSLVANVESFERDLYKKFALWEGIPEESIPRCEYGRRFHLQSLETEIRNALAIAKLQIGNKALKPLAQTLLTKQLKEMGVDETVIEEAVNEAGESLDNAEEMTEQMDAKDMEEQGRASIEQVKEYQPAG